MRLRFSGVIVSIAALAGLVLTGCGDPQDGESPSLRVAAAASLRPTLTQLARDYEAAGGSQLKVSYAGSALLARQVVEGAPFDVLLTADAASMDIAADRGAVGHPRPFLSNRAVVVVSPHARHPIESVADLARPGVVVAVCAPQAACGAVADRVLAQAQVDVDAPARESDVNAVMAKVRLGEADAGIVYWTDAILDRADRPVKIVDVTPRVTTTYFAARVAGRGSTVTAHARDLLDFLTSANASVVFQRHGFGRP